MENKLTLREIAPYLPYGLKFATLNDDTNEYYIDANRYILDFGGLNGVANICMDNYSRPLYKIILRPLSDLTEEIEHNVEEFIPLDELTEGHTVRFSLPNYSEDWDNRTYYSFDKYIEEWINGDVHHLNFIPFGFIQKLYEWHFDVHGLIEKGLAIDINTL